MDRWNTIYDISLDLERAPAYPGDPVFERTEAAHPADGGRLSALSLCAHSGTHLDAPSHVLPGGPDLDAFPLERFLPPALVVDLPGRARVRAADVAGLDIRPGDAVLFRTDNSVTGRVRGPRFDPDHVHLSPDAAEALVRAGASLVGLDASSLDGPGEDGLPVHRTLLGAGILLLENIDLAEVPPGRYILCCLPLNMPGAEASPVRAVLLRPGEHLES